MKSWDTVCDAFHLAGNFVYKVCNLLGGGGEYVDMVNML